MFESCALKNILMSSFMSKITDVDVAPKKWLNLNRQDVI